MRFIVPAAAMLAAAAIVSPVHAQGGNAQQQATPKLSLSKQATPALAELQAAVNANDVANIPAKIAAAKAAVQNKDDRALLGQLQLKAALASNDLAALADAIETLASSQFLDAAKTSGLYRDLGVRQFNAKQNAAALASFQKAAALTPNDPETLELLGQGQLAAGQSAQGVATLQRAIAARAATGQKPPEDIYRKAVQAAFDAQLPTASEVARQWLIAYPSPSAWRNTLAIYAKLNPNDTAATLPVLRLMHATGAMTSATEYGAYINLLLQQSNFNEAQAVLDQGIAAKVIDTSNGAHGALITSVRSKPKATAADLAAAAKTAQSGAALLRIGDRYYGLGDYAKAVEMYRAAQARGVDASTVNLYIGMALARAGDKAGATAAFNSVSGGLAGVAKFWLLHLQQA
ncbi:MAG TPA: hypothetical protein VM308_04770 [Sphingomicrobium sp.]|nr:hypothetical protein [Sphingomicrobium sp.]